MNHCPLCQLTFDPAAIAGLCPRCALAGALGPAITGAPDDDYEIIGELGRGAMGVVSLARQRSLDRLVALKVIATGGRPVEWLEQRLLREARAAAALDHRHIVAIHDIGRNATGALFSMEYCEGGNLRDHQRHQPLSPRASATLVAKLAGALAHAHGRGVLHRDLKPGNILLAADGEPKISDFGLTSPPGGGDLTQTGEVAGSPAYLAPERLSPDHRPSPADDIYGLGAILYECLTGRPPFRGESVQALLAQIVRDEPVSPRLLERAVPRDLETIVLKCVHKNPAARYATAAALHEDLQRFLAGQPIAARPVSPLGRVWRSARRNPALALASTVAFFLLVTVAVGSSLAALRLERANALTASARDRAETSARQAAASGAQAREQLRVALIAQARANRLTGREGQRTQTLAVLRRAAEIRPDLEARDEAIAALMLPDWRTDPARKTWSDPGLSTATPLPGFRAFIHETEAGAFSRRTFPAGRVEWTWPGTGQPSAGQTVVSPDARWVAVRLRDDTIHVLDAVTGTPVFALADRPFVFKSSRIWGYGVDMAFSPDGTRFAATHPTGGVSLHAVPGGELIGEWKTDAWLVTVAFSPNGRWLAVGGSRERGQNVAALLDGNTGSLLARDTPLSRVDFLAWSDDDRWVAVGSRPVQVRSSADFSVRTFVPDRGALHGRFLPGADQLLLSDQIGQTRLWDIDSGRLLMTKADSGRPGTWFDGQPIRQWRYFSAGDVHLQTFEPSAILTSHRLAKASYTVTNIADPLDLSLDARWLILGGPQRPLLLDLTTGASFPLGPEKSPGSLAVGRLEEDGHTLWIGQSAGPLRRHQLSFVHDRPILDEGQIVPGHDGFLPTALHRPAGLIVLTHYQNGRVRLFETGSLRIRAEWALPRASHAVFSPDGRLVLTNAEPTPQGCAEIRDTTDGHIVHTPGPGAGRAVAWSPDGRLLLAGVGARETKLLRAATWSPGPALPFEYQSSNYLAAYSNDSRLLALRQEDGFVVLLRADTAELLARLELPDSVRYVCALRFTPDDRTLIVVRSDGRIDLINLAALDHELGKLGLAWAP